MTYHVFADRGNGDLYLLARFSPGACLENCWFYDQQLWHPERGFRRGRFRIKNYLLVDQDDIEANGPPSRLED